ncbi:MAG: hydrogenase formation protein HypD [Betaproteobacteria bacterium]|nr:hydrogenase formation protein HypD [Betaproteobacteria bacterium]
MKYIEEFRDGNLARKIADSIARETDSVRLYRFMEFCGGHTHAIARYGLTALLPPQIKMIHGPGCPVCVLPIGRVDQAIQMALEHGVILAVYGDCLRVPASGGLTLLKARAEGADVRMVYSTKDALALARAHPDKQVVFFAIGFETTAPPTAAAIAEAKAANIANFSVLCCHLLTPAAILGILEDDLPLDGMVGPAHVSAIIGSAPYEFIPERYQKPVVIAGFEPLDVLQAILMLLRQVNAGYAVVENEFTRVVTRTGNEKAKRLLQKYFAVREQFEWRGLGRLPESALCLKPEYAQFDAEARHPVPYRPVPDHKACECAHVLRGHKEPGDCKAFGVACTPENPLGACMVSSEGACAAFYTYGRRQ